MAELRIIPTLEAISRDPAIVRELPHDVLETLALRAAAVCAALETQLNLSSKTPAVARSHPHDENGDRMLLPVEAAKLLHRKPRWIYRHDTLPFVIRINDRFVLCSERRLHAWLAAQKA